ncbi:hypothetical protein Cgig2_015881 [Carnegiea gigantea]|uniref:Uncharacterized protein n=1 Tax=Carnegiea gigantea TaxID=171969 RepID=A0A9Q1JHI4_9CARY|nr:hypothetical protein Cgig2_015881 [Carnegiea gigantea]
MMVTKAMVSIQVDKFQDLVNSDKYLKGKKKIERTLGYIALQEMQQQYLIPCQDQVQLRCWPLKDLHLKSPGPGTVSLVEGREMVAIECSREQLAWVIQQSVLALCCRQMPCQTQVPLPSECYSSPVLHYAHPLNHFSWLQNYKQSCLLVHG